MTACRQRSIPIRDQAGTPQWLFDLLHKEYQFTIDVCANEHNAKLSRFVSPETNGLSLLWWTNERVWCNPPYSDIAPWLAFARQAVFACFLLPVRTDRYWWRWHKHSAECHYFVGEKPHRRIQFDPPPGIVYSSNSGCNCLFLFGEGTQPGTEWYRSGRTGERL